MSSLGPLDQRKGREHLGRPITQPAAADRLILTALAELLNDSLDPRISPSAQGFRKVLALLPCINSMAVYGFYGSGGRGQVFR